MNDHEDHFTCPKCGSHSVYFLNNVGMVCTKCSYCPNKQSYLKASYDPVENREQDYSSTYVDHDTHVDY